MSILVSTPDGHTAEFPDGTDPSVIQAAMAKTFGGPDNLSKSLENIAAQHERIKPTEDSFMGNLPAAIGKGATDAGYGAAQFLAHTSPLAQAYEYLKGSGPISSIDNAITQKAKTDQPLAEAPGGTTGNMIGSTMVLAPLTRGSPALQGAVAGAIEPVPGVGQNVEGLITGQKPTDYFSQKGKDIGIGAAAGYGTQKALQGLGTLANKLMNPASTVLNTAAGKAATSDFAKEGEQLAQRTGVNLTPGEVTGSKAQISIENNSRQSIASKNIAFAADQNKAQQWVDYVNRTLDGIASGGDTAASAGERVQGAVKNALTDIGKAREAAATTDYGQVRAMLQGKPAIVPQNYLGKLQELGQEFAGGPEGSDYAKLAKTLGSLQENGLQNADIATLMKTRRFLSQVAGGQVQLAGETGRGLQKSVATQLLGAIDSDLDASATKLGGPVGDMLKQANTRYRGFSQQMEGLQNSALGKLVGEDFAQAVGSGTFNQIPGETVMQRLAAMKPSQLAGARGILEQYDPETWQTVKRAYLESALNKAQSAAPSEGANVIAARPNVFVNAIAKTPEDQTRLATIFSAKEQAQINDAIATARRMSDRSGFNASGTAQAAEMTALGSSGTAALLGHPAPLLAIGGKMFTNREIANVMLNSQGRALVQELNRLPPGSQRFTQLASQLAAIAGADAANSPGAPSQ